MELQDWSPHQQSLVFKKKKKSILQYFLQLPIQASHGTLEEILVLPVTWSIFASEASHGSLHGV